MANSEEEHAASKNPRNRTNGRNLFMVHFLSEVFGGIMHCNHSNAVSGIHNRSWKSVNGLLVSIIRFHWEESALIALPFS